MKSPALAPYLLTLILINTTGHMALSGGRVSGSLYILQAGHAEALVGLYMALFSVIAALVSLSIGRWVDRAGALRVMRVGAIALLVGAWLPVLHLSLMSLVATSLLLGLGFNLVTMAAQHTVGRIDPSASSAERLANFGWFALGHSTSSVAGPLLAGLLIDSTGVRSAFAAMAVFTSVAAWLVFSQMRGFVPAEPVATDATPSQHQRDHALDLFKSAELRRIYGVNALTATSWDLFIVMLPILGHRLGFSASVIGSVYACFAMGTFVIRAAMPWLSRHFSEWQMLRTAMIVIVLAYLLMPWLALAPLLMLVGIMFGAAVGLSQPSMLSLLHRAAPAARSGEAVGLRALISNVCSVVVPLAFGASLSVVSLPVVLLGAAALFGLGIHPTHQGVKNTKDRRRAT